MKLQQAAEKRIHIALFGALLKWSLIGGMVGILTGSASALFLSSLDLVTSTRTANPWLLWLLPLGGAVISYLYMQYGKDSAQGNNLILSQIHGTSGTIPLRMAPLVLLGTLTTHLFGGSAGREGTAVQMGGSLADWFGRLLKLTPLDRKIILMCGISGGFGSIFGTPLAGTLFALEVLAFGLVSYEAVLPCFAASFVGHLVTSSWGIYHIHYTIGEIPPMSPLLIGKVVIASILFGLAGLLFSQLTHALKKLYAKWFKNPVIKSFAGGLIVISLVYLTGSRDYLGLGIPLIQQSFEESMSPLVFLLKTLFTSVTLGAGFQGGEVTPLFVIGSTLGSALADILAVPVPFLAALGFVAVFCGAANTPIACFIMGIELFGSEGAVYLFIACIISYLFSGHTGIYTAQRIGTAKSRFFIPDQNASLGSLRLPKEHADKQP
ncbi:voltage-gated chloride channel protein [Paenibacillus sambharensis]|uniref:Voltage-gated chloride channel protein n=2 Tax=Paenibacillus sambharensis TaxID=1803190 RepID=A0A2W1LNY2_9BACL|nr:voltage-gated chloride channel family protein [Paenibacillus sambharensis]PZD96214.1 voltage-gated chloride channel protein [Paenibacillus sambharensis]